MSVDYLIDMSAWARLQHPKLSRARSEHVAQAITDGRVHACPPFLLELGYSARNHPDYAALMALVHDAMPFVPLTPECVAHHRVKPNDLLVAAIAADNDLTVLHFDKHYPVIAQRSGRDVRVEWLAPSKSLA